MLKNFSLSIASIVVCLLLLEIGLRAANGLPLIPDRNLIFDRAHITDVDHLGIAAYDPQLGWALVPNFRSTSFTTGEDGVRMNQPSIQPVPRDAIVAVGDSFTAGSDVGDTDSWPAWLERSIHRPVVNAGVGGWGTDQIVMHTEAILPKLTPKIVIVDFLDDDIQRDEYSVFGGLDKPYFKIENGTLVRMNDPIPRAVGAKANLGWVRQILGYSYLVDFTMSHLQDRSWFVISTEVKQPVDGAAVSCLLLARLKHEIDARNIPLLFVMQWGGSEIAQWNVRPEFAATVLDCARRAGIRTLDTWDSLKSVYAGGAENLKSLYNMQQGGTVYGHMSPAGNKYIAGLVAQALANDAATQTALGN